VNAAMEHIVSHVDSGPSKTAWRIVPASATIGLGHSTSVGPFAPMELQKAGPLEWHGMAQADRFTSKWSPTRDLSTTTRVLASSHTHRDI